jgi:hypothetical protein
VLSTRNEAPLIEAKFKVVYPELKGSDHESKGEEKDHDAYFMVDDVEYAQRFAKALRRAVELCGGLHRPFNASAHGKGRKDSVCTNSNSRASADSLNELTFPSQIKWNTRICCGPFFKTAGT